MDDLLIKDALLADGSVLDVAVRHGKIVELGRQEGPARRTVRLDGRWRLSAGWIDGHVHCNPASPIYHDEPDQVGVAGGVTTVVDAGSVGADDVAAFRELAGGCRTDVRALLNISRIGLATQHELANLDDVDVALAGAAIRAHRDFIVGIKARLSGSVVGTNGVAPLARAKEIQRRFGPLPLMVHIGNTPPSLDEIAEWLEPGDIVTHCFNGKPNRILDAAGALRASVRAAIERGVLLDVGHGSASFSFRVAREAMALGAYPDTISSDIYCRNRVSGPVFGLAAVMSKFLSLGMPLERVLDCVTRRPAEALRLSGKGRLEVGADADLTIFDIETAPRPLSDSEGDTLTGVRNLAPLAAVAGGVLLPTEQGKACHVFDL